MKWYDKGVNFSCTGCGGCCTGFPGYVWLTEKDILAMCELLKITPQEFIKKNTRTYKNKLSLKEIYPSYDCIFFKDKKCEIYSARPLQCRLYPFWPEVMQSQNSWDQTEQFCPGINKGSHHTQEEIDKSLLIHKREL